MKYKELVAFEVNEFKEGDYVIVYSGSGAYKGTVEGVIEDNVFINQDNYPYRSSLQSHFKQCRKLEEVKPREFYLLVGHNNVIHQASPDKNVFEKYCKEAVVKVREVLEDE